MAYARIIHHPCERCKEMDATMEVFTENKVSQGFYCNHCTEDVLKETFANDA